MTWPPFYGDFMCPGQYCFASVDDPPRKDRHSSHRADDGAARRARRESDPVSLKDLSAATGLHPSTAHRILNDMVVGRFVDRAETPGSYRLGMRLLELGNLVKARLSVREAALEPMRELHQTTGQTVNLSVRQGDEIV